MRFKAVTAPARRRPSLQGLSLELGAWVQEVTAVPLRAPLCPLVGRWHSKPSTGLTLLMLRS